MTWKKRRKNSAPWSGKPHQIQQLPTQQSGRELKKKHPLISANAIEIYWKRPIPLAKCDEPVPMSPVTLVMSSRHVAASTSNSWSDSRAVFQRHSSSRIVLLPAPPKPTEHCAISMAFPCKSNWWHNCPKWFGASSMMGSFSWPRNSSFLVDTSAPVRQKLRLEYFYDFFVCSQDFNWT